MSKPAFSKVSNTKDPSKCKKVDALRLKKYIGCFISQSKNLPLKEFCSLAKAPVEHLFNCHEWCDPSWCWARNLSDSIFKEITTKMKTTCLNVDENQSNRTLDNVSISDFSSGGSDFNGASSEESEYDNDNNDDDSIFISEDEKRQLYSIDDIVGKEDCEEVMFSIEDRQKFKEHELSIMKRNSSSYYRCKVKHSELYHQMTLDMARFISPDMLSMLQHDWSTQINEAMNNSVASYAPKSRTYSTTNSLEARVNIAGATQVIGHKKFWTKIFEEFEVKIDDNLLHVLQCKDKRKLKKKIHDKTKEGKRKQSELKYQSLADNHKKQMIDLKNGHKYETGISISEARKSLKDVPARNIGCKETWTCIYYHPKYCTKKGHKDCRSKECAMHGKTIEERNAAKEIIQAEKLQVEMTRLATEKLDSCTKRTYNLRTGLVGENENHNAGKK